MHRKGLLKIALQALVLVACATCALTGCEKTSSSPAPEAGGSSASERMHDKTYRTELAEKQAEMKTAVGARNEIARELSELIDAMKAKLNTEDMDKVTAALEKTPEWQTLQARLKTATEEFEARRQATMATIRNRMNKKTISK